MKTKKVMDIQIVVALLGFLGVVIGASFTAIKRQSATVTMDDLLQKLNAQQAQINRLEKEVAVLNERINALIERLE